MKLLERTKFYYFFFNSKGGNFNVRQIEDTAKNKPSVKNKMSGSSLRTIDGLLNSVLKSSFCQIFCEKILILCFLMKEQVIRKKNNLRKLFFMNNAETGARNALQ